MLRKFISIGLLFLFMCPYLELHGLDPEFERNGEVYLAVPELGEHKGIIYRLNDPSGELGGTYPRSLIDAATELGDLNAFFVDISRKIYTLSDPDITEIGADYKFKRQVLDGTKLLKPKYTAEHNDGKWYKRYGTYYYSTYVENRYNEWKNHKEMNMEEDTGNVTEDNSDWGCHRYIHTDHRSDEFPAWNSGTGYTTDLYRTTLTPTHDGTKRYSRGHYSRNNYHWTSFDILQGNKVSAPADPLSVLPDFTNAKANPRDTSVDKGLVALLTLPPFAGKDWYEVPNGAWYSSWKAWKGCSSHGTGYYYMSYCDVAAGTQYDWKRVDWSPKYTNNVYDYDNYNANGSGNIYARTYDMTISRSIRAACLDSCGFSSTSASMEPTSVFFHSTFMPYSVSDTTEVRVYSYQREEDSDSASLILPDDVPESNIIKIGDPVGVGNARDTKWIGASKGPGNTDYIYYLGNSVIKDWAAGVGNQNIEIAAISVSNQWNQKGGIIFAYDTVGKGIFTITAPGSSDTAPGSPNANTIFTSTNTILNSIGAGSGGKIDEIAADGQGRLYVSLTYPSSKFSVEDPVSMGLDLDDALRYSDVASGSEGMDNRTFYFEVPYEKTVWRLTHMGEGAEKIGDGIKLGKAKFTRLVSMKNGMWPNISVGNAQTPIDATAEISRNNVTVGNFVITNIGSVDNVKSRMAVINAPTPPHVLTLPGGSYIDLIGPYTSFVAPIAFNTNQTAPVVGNPLDLGKTYFYMVENYPVPSGVQNPNNDSDPDGDNRRSGFVSTIKRKSDGELDIEYVWKKWLIKDKDGLLSVPEMREERNSYFNYINSPVNATYILTCKAKYKWDDYNKVKAGMSKEAWETSQETDLGKNLTDYAIPTNTETGDTPAKQDSKERIKDLLKGIIADDSKRQAFADKIISDTTSDFNDNFCAIEIAIASGSTLVLEEPYEVAQIERANPGATITNTDSWNTSGSYHGISSGSYDWRISIASQAFFFDSLSPNMSSNPYDDSGIEKVENTDTNSAYYYYDQLADKLLNDQNQDYFINVNYDATEGGIKFDRTGNDLRWKGEPEITATLNYQYPENGGVASKALALDASDLGKFAKSENATFTYLTLKNLPVTDPFIATLTIEMVAELECDMYLYGNIPDSSGNLNVAKLDSKPTRFPKLIKLSGQATIMVVDSAPPKILYSKTMPKNSINGVAGELLTGGNITFVIEDNNVWEGTDQESHSDWVIGNFKYNKDILANSSAGSDKNLKPVFNPDYRYVKLSYDIPVENGNKWITELASTSFFPGHGREYTVNSDGALTETFEAFKNEITMVQSPSIVGESYSADSYSAEFACSIPLNKLAESNQLPRALKLPINYANNTPGYRPYNFYIEAMDASGNKFDTKRLNVYVDIIDKTAPYPFGIVKEWKSGGETRFPEFVASPDSETWVASFTKATIFDLENNDSDWEGNETEGIIPDTGMKSLPQESIKIASFSTMPLALLEGDDVVVPANITIEDNVGVTITAGAVDNSASTTTVILKYRYFDFQGAEQSIDVDTGSITTTKLEENTVSSQVIFREGKVNDKKMEFPYLIPITIIAKDVALDYGSYTNDTAAQLDEWDGNWGKYTPGDVTTPNEREFKTSLPVYGSKMEIRTIDRHLIPRK